MVRARRVGRRSRGGRIAASKLLIASKDYYLIGDSAARSIVATADRHAVPFPVNLALRRHMIVFAGGF